MGIMDGEASVVVDRSEWNSSCVDDEIKEECSLFKRGFCRNTILSTESEVDPLVASKNHKEAERRRRQRINSRLDYLRHILPSTSKMDKASLMGKVIKGIEEMKEKTWELRRKDSTPSENDQVVVFSADFSEEGRSRFEASVCCDDRFDLIPNLIDKLRSLNLRTVRLEMANTGPRIKHMLVLVEEGEEGQSRVSVEILEKTLMSVLECSISASRPSKRRR